MALTGRKASESRERIVDAASRALRRSGVRGVSVADIMKEAGLTHGGFYAHFPSRDALVSEALVRAGSASSDIIGEQMALLVKKGMSPFRALVECYLSPDHVADSENGCPLPAVCQEASRQAAEVGEASRQVIRSLHKRLSQVLPKGAPRASAWPIASALIGAVQLSRALGATADGRAVLASTKSELLARYDA
jgi:TetR/AcrR family transcriptional regulator, transcriptional repressor for nem operon